MKGGSVLVRICSNTTLHPFNRRRVSYIWDVLRELVARDIKLRYKGSVLGMVWSLLIPLAQLGVFYFVFRFVLPMSIPHYASFIFSGLLVWNWFQGSLCEAAGVITSSRELVKRPGFPITILPVVTVSTNLIHFLLALPILLFVLRMGGTPLKPVVFVLPLVLVLQFIFILSLAYLAAAINVLFRDTQHLLGIGLQLLFFLTPVFYSIQTIPTSYHSFYQLNPMTHLIEAYRTILLHGHTPNWLPLVILSVCSFGLLVLGFQIFLHMSYRFAEEL